MRWCLGLWLALFLCHLVGSSFCCCVSGSCKGPDLCSAGDASLNISPTRSQVWLGRLHLNSHFLKIRVRFRVNIQIFNKNFIKNFACKPDLYDLFFFFSFSCLFPKSLLFTASSWSYQDASYRQSSPSGDSRPFKPVWVQHCQRFWEQQPVWYLSGRIAFVS